MSDISQEPLREIQNELSKTIQNGELLSHDYFVQDVDQMEMESFASVGHQLIFKRSRIQISMRKRRKT